MTRCAARNHRIHLSRNVRRLRESRNGHMRGVPAGGHQPELRPSHALRYCAGRVRRAVAPGGTCAQGRPSRRRAIVLGAASGTCFRLMNRPCRFRQLGRGGESVDSTAANTSPVICICTAAPRRFWDWNKWPAIVSAVGIATRGSPRAGVFRGAAHRLTGGASRCSTTSSRRGQRSRIARRCYVPRVQSSSAPS